MRCLPLIAALLFSCATFKAASDEDAPAWSALYKAGGAHGGTGTVCRVSADGVQVCGYDCKRGGDGQYKCAHTAEGFCTVGEDKRVSCYDPLYHDVPARDGGMR